MSSNANIEKSPHTLLNKYLDHMRVQFKQSFIVKTTSFNTILNTLPFVSAKYDYTYYTCYTAVLLTITKTDVCVINYLILAPRQFVKNISRFIFILEYVSVGETVVFQTRDSKQHCCPIRATRLKVAPNVAKDSEGAITHFERLRSIKDILSIHNLDKKIIKFLRLRFRRRSEFMSAVFLANCTGLTTVSFM